jgi:hypothetical protein
VGTETRELGQAHQGLGAIATSAEKLWIWFDRLRIGGAPEPRNRFISLDP